jgi:predicted nucleotidyltransferase/L-rhamnose mutarotase
VEISEYPEVTQLLQELLQHIKAVLGQKLVGLYVYGSLATGDFDRKVSDIDLLAAVSSDIEPDEFDALKTMHEDFAAKHPAWNDRIEVQYISTTALKTFKSKINKATVISPGEPFHTIDVGDHWLMNWYVVREKGIPLFGPPPTTLIAPVSKAEFIGSVRKHTQSWNEWVKVLRSRKAQAYSILTMCRALYAVKEGEQPSKEQAAHWVADEFPEWSEVVTNAMAWRQSDEDVENDEVNYPKAEAFVNFARDRILKESE